MLSPVWRIIGEPLKECRWRCWLSFSWAHKLTRISRSDAASIFTILWKCTFFFILLLFFLGCGNFQKLKSFWDPLPSIRSLKKKTTTKHNECLVYFEKKIESSFMTREPYFTHFLILLGQFFKAFFNSVCCVLQQNSSFAMKQISYWLHNIPTKVVKFKISIPLFPYVLILPSKTSHRNCQWDCQMTLFIFKVN